MPLCHLTQPLPELPPHHRRVCTFELRRTLLSLPQGDRSSAQLMALNASNPHGAEPDARGDPGLYGLFWRFAGDACAVQPDVANLARGVKPKTAHRV